MKILWYINHADGPHPWYDDGRPTSSPEHIRALAQTIDRCGFYGALTVGPGTTGAGSEGWIESASLINLTTQMRFLIPIYPGIIPPTLLAQYARQFDALSNGRLIFNQVNGTDPILDRYGIRLPKNERYQLSTEYFAAFKRLYAGDEQAYEGKYFRYGAAPANRTTIRLSQESQRPRTPIWGSGASVPGISHAGKTLDAYLTYLHHPEKLALQIHGTRTAARENGRSITIGTLTNIILRDTEEEAWEHAQWLLDTTGAAGLARQIDTRLKFREFEAGGFTELRSPDPAIQARIESLRQGIVPRARDLEVSPQLWAGPSIWGPLDFEGRGWGVYLIGTAAQIAKRMKQLQHSLGIDIFILAGWPLTEEAERVAQQLLPLLELDHASSTIASD